MAGKPPYFPFYVKDFAADSKVEAMPTEGVGAYILMLCKAWQEDPPASLPNDDATLARWARLDRSRWLELKDVVLAPFVLGTDNRYHQKRLRQEFDKAIGLVKTRSAAGREGANGKWQTPEYVRGRADRYQRMKEAKEKGTHTDDEWFALKAACGNKCLRCGAEGVQLVKDHIKPIYQGGSDSLLNVQPLCKPCNSSKGPEVVDYRPPGIVEGILSGISSGKTTGKTTGKALFTGSDSGSGSDSGFAHEDGGVGEGVRADFSLSAEGLAQAWAFQCTARPTHPDRDVFGMTPSFRELMRHAVPAAILAEIMRPGRNRNEAFFELERRLRPAAKSKGKSMDERLAERRRLRANG